MRLRLLDSVVQIFKVQLRQWSRTHDSFASVRLQPVLPVVLYTGSQRWDKLAPLSDLIELGELFDGVTPLLNPLFLSLPALAPERLATAGGALGQAGG